jgi:hypothetical protein
VRSSACKRHWSASGGFWRAADDWQGEELRNDDEAYVLLLCGPGGGGNSGEIPLCGNGRGVFQVTGEFLIFTQLSACDLPYSENA